MQKFDVLIIGSGLAGQSAALRLAPHCRVALISKRSLEDSASGWAQGGIAAVLDSQDSIEAHIRDTLIAGAWLNDENATRFVVENGRRAIEWLIDQGVPFTKDESGYHLTREGGHSARRVIHVADATGLAVQDTLTKKVRANANITILEDHIAIDLITGEKLGTTDKRCYGAYVLNNLTGEVITVGAPHTLIATGGAGKVYLYTTNPDTSTGDGIAMAYRAGCRVSNMEFIQFHPTCLYHPQAKSFLISEAVRGEGGLLKLPDGTRFMLEHDERAELAPRDIVPRATDFEMKKRGLDCVCRRAGTSHALPVRARDRGGRISDLWGSVVVARGHDHLAVDDRQRRRLTRSGDCFLGINGMASRRLGVAAPRQWRSAARPRDPAQRPAAAASRQPWCRCPACW